MKQVHKILLIPLMLLAIVGLVSAQATWSRFSNVNVTGLLSVEKMNVANCDVKAATNGTFYCGTDNTAAAGVDYYWHHANVSQFGYYDNPANFSLGKYFSNAANFSLGNYYTNPANFSLSKYYFHPSNFSLGSYYWSLTNITGLSACFWNVANMTDANVGNDITIAATGKNVSTDSEIRVNGWRIYNNGTGLVIKEE